MNTTSPSRRAYAYEKPSLADMQSHLQAAQNEQNAHTCVLHEAWAKVPPMSLTSLNCCNSAKR